VFYPRYFEMINQVVEDWFAGPLGQDFRSLHEELNTGVPTVSIECKFTRPSRLGDRLTFRLGVERLGGSSFTLDIVADHDGEQRVKARLVLVCVDLETIGVRPIPDRIRARMSAFELHPAV
jgi:4-hydroxybenzoyl-CoA thioesterase